MGVNHQWGHSATLPDYVHEELWYCKWSQSLSLKLRTHTDRHTDRHKGRKSQAWTVSGDSAFRAVVMPPEYHSEHARHVGMHLTGIDWYYSGGMPIALKVAVGLNSPFIKCVQACGCWLRERQFQGTSGFSLVLFHEWNPPARSQRAFSPVAVGFVKSTVNATPLKIFWIQTFFEGG